MNHLNKHLAATLLATLGFAAMAQMPPPGGPGTSGPGAGRAEHGHMDPQRMQEYLAKRQAALKEKLQITPAQEGAWTTYMSALKPASNVQRPERGEFDKLTTPERIDRMRALRVAHEAEMDKRADATKAFYAALTPEQKKVFDAETLRHARGGHGGHGHMG
jgi:periplasmic protein CpxP/Spy